MDENATMIEIDTQDYVDMTVDVVSAYVSNNNLQVAELPALVASIHAALAGLSQPTAPSEPAVEQPTPAQIHKSITHDAIVSFVDGKSYKTLKRHLSKHGLDERSYRARYGLPADYPMTATSYSEARSALAKSLGLGRGGLRQAPAEPEPVAEVPTERPKRAGRPRKDAGTTAA